MSDVITAVSVPVLAPTLTIGLDVGDRYIHACVVDSTRKVLEEFKFPTDQGGLAKKLSRPGCQIILEVGPHSRWMQKSLEELGHGVRVVDARKVELISKGTMKTDQRDARTLALLGAGVPELLGDVKHRSEQAQADLGVLLTRDHFIDLRTATINRVRGVLKSFGIKVARMSTKAFHKRVGELVPAHLQPALVPLLEELGTIHLRIQRLDDTIQREIAARYPAVERLTQVDGVGTLTALAYALSIGDPSRFKKSRDIGPFVGLCPRKHSSGESDPQLSITRAGNPFLRRILVQSAQYALGPFGPDCELRRHGEKLVLRGGKCAKKRAVVAVARKMAVLLHRLWVNTSPYDPWYQHKRRGVEPSESQSKTTRKPKVTRRATSA
jgi:transposase